MIFSYGIILYTTYLILILPFLYFASLFIMFLSNLFWRPFKFPMWCQRLTLIVSLILWFLSSQVLILLLCYSNLEFISRLPLNWIKFFECSINIHINLYIWCFVWITTFIFLISILSIWNTIRYKLVMCCCILMLLQTILIYLFLVDDLLIFYILFEAILPPMYLLIGIWGSRQRRTYAAYLFFFYTSIASFIMLFVLILIYVNIKSFDMTQLLITKWAFQKECFIWFGLFLAFAVKIPMFPVHIWLPEAHVEAPTVGSIILAGILLKVGSFGFLKYLIPLCPNANFYYTPVVITLATAGIIYTGLMTVRQIDLKKIIAYASVTHMNYIVLALMVPSISAYTGAVYLMLGHAIVSSALFYLIGCLYERYHTRIIYYYHGLVNYMPMFICFFFIFTLSNIAFPGTCNFIAELLILVSIAPINLFITACVVMALLTGVLYSIWLFNRISLGHVSVYYTHDLSKRESTIMSLLTFHMVLLGLWPNVFIDSLQYNMAKLVIINILRNF